MPRDRHATAQAEAEASAEGQRPCARDAWCTGYRLVPNGDGTPKRAAALTHTAFCLADTALIAARLHPRHGLPAAYWWLRADLGNPVRRGEMVRVPFGPRMLLSEYYDALMRRITEVLCSWEQRVREVHRLSAPPPEPDGYKVVLRAAGTVGGERLSSLLARPRAPMLRRVPSGELKAAEPGRVSSPVLALWQDAVLHDNANGMAVIRASLSGTDAGTEILDLFSRCLSALGQIAPPAEILDGIPCRVCGNMSLERDQAATSPPRCASCRQPIELAGLGTETAGEAWEHAAQPPDGHGARPERPSMYSRCASPRCESGGDRMSLRTFRDWVRRYEAYVSSAGPLTCQRCQNGDCGQCIFPGCEHGPGCLPAGTPHRARPLHGRVEGFGGHA